MAKKKKKKMPTSFGGKSTRLGQGGRFAKCVSDAQKKGKSKTSAEKICASRGRKKYGSKRMGKWSAQGRKRSVKKKK